MADTGLGFFMDGYLMSNIDEAKRVIKKDFDMIFCIDGTEGGGKSVLAQQLAKYCDNSFCIDRICMTPEEFTKQIINAQKYQAVVYDEAYTGLSSKDTMGSVNKALCTMLAEIRQKNLFVFVVMPTFFDLTKYVALWRSRALIHIYLHDGFERGFFTFFNTEKKKDLYVYGKKTYNYNCVKSNFHGRFPNFYTVDEQAYRDKKWKALQDKSKRPMDRHELSRAGHFKTLVTELNRRKILTQAQIGEILGVTRERITAIVQSVDYSNI